MRSRKNINGVLTRKRRSINHGNRPAGVGNQKEVWFENDLLSKLLSFFVSPPQIQDILLCGPPYWSPIEFDMSPTDFGDPEKDAEEFITVIQF